MRQLVLSEGKISVAESKAAGGSFMEEMGLELYLLLNI